MSRGDRGRRRQRGQALVEFALVFPVFILLLAAMIDFGMGFYSYITLISAAREGARYGAVACASTTAVCTTPVATKATNMAGGLAPLTVTVKCGPTGTTTCTTTPAVGDMVKVTVDYTYHMLWPLTFGTSIPLSASVSMLIEK